MAKVRRRIRNGKEEKWVVDYFDQYKKRHIKTFDTKREATAWLSETTVQVKKGIHTPERDSITVAEAGQLWIARGNTENLERSTLKQYENHVNLHINPLLGGVKLAHLSVPVVEEFKDKMLGKASRPMVRWSL